MRNRIYKLHPELEGKNVDQQFGEAIDRLWPEYLHGAPKLYRGLLIPYD
jgi:hypothetical protein